jgi:cold shock CspA family protein
MQGPIQYYSPRGFGFIVTKTTTYYFHVKNFSGEPVVGTRVRFDLGPSLVPNKPPQAINVAGVETDALIEGVKNAMGADEVSS